MSYYLLRDRSEIEIASIFKLKRMYETADVNASDVVRKSGTKNWQPVGDILGLSFRFTAGDSWRSPIPEPPPISWWVVLILGALTFGYAVYVVGAIQAVWARRVQRRWLPILFAMVGVATPPAHLCWIVHSILHARHHFEGAIVDIVVGFIVAEIAAALCTSMGSLGVRRSMMNKFKDRGFRMNWLLTAIIGPVFVAWSLEEFRNSYR